MEQIGPLLYDILLGTNLPATDKVEDPLRDLLTQVTAQTSIDFRNYKSSTILRRVGRRMAVTHNTTIRDYSDFLQTHPDEVHELVKAFLIKVTGFFRDPEAYDVLKQTVIPDLVNRAKENGRTLRFWSAGCATGEEAYSLALLLADSLGSDFPEWNVKIFATDLSSDAINFARRGIYPENVLNDLPVEYKKRYFEHFDNGYRISKALRQVVIFGHQDITHGVPFPRMDLVSCRNLLIYLKPELQQVVLDLFAYSLQPSHGFLILGKAETARPSKANFDLVDKKWKIYRCLGGPAALPAHPAMSTRARQYDMREPRRQAMRGPVLTNMNELMEAEIDVTQLRRINETILRYTDVAFVIIDRAYRIVTTNAAARRLLAIRDIAYDQDFLHTVTGLPYRDVRSAIDNAFRERSSMNLLEIELDHSGEGSRRYVNFTVMVMNAEPTAPELAIISAMDVTELVIGKRQMEAVQREHADMVKELSEANRRYTTMNKELQDANEELQAANEELMLTQEELQATNEEFEATNEELQTTNDDLSARTLELRDFSKQFRVEQLQLSTLLERFPHYVMVLDAKDLTIQSINPGYRELLAGREVIGLPISEAFGGKQLGTLLKLLRRVATDGQPLTSDPMNAVVDGTGNGTFVHTIVPISDVGTGRVERLFIYSEKME
jgi:two-component system CheB/CheR fusion protein